jgi:hypothetical protein
MNHGVEERSSESGREWLGKKEGKMKKSSWILFDVDKP